MKTYGKAAKEVFEKLETKKLPQHLRTGRNGELRAHEFLEGLGYEFIEKNWRYGHLELDLIFRDGDTIAFIEVKTRSSNLRGGAACAVTQAKKAKLFKAAVAWLQAHDMWESPCRFDVVCLTGQDGNFIVEHYKDAFDAGHVMGCCDSSWQQG